jgi:DNA-binding CsgD family transcriptional regulator
VKPGADQSSNNFDLRALEVWANKEPVARFIMDTDLVLCWANSAAADLLASQQDGVGAIQGKLIFFDEANQASFLALVNQESSSPATTILDCGTPLGRVVVAVIKLSVDHRPLVGVTLRLPHAVTMMPGLLRSAFGLTKTECELISLLLRGQTAEEAAVQMRISVVTARTHIRNLYAKLNVSSREAMFSRLLPYLSAG